MLSTAKRHHTITIVTIISAIANTLMAIFKIIIGYFGFSQALIADGVHSFSDLITDALVLVASRMASQSPDKEHPYGHRRIETIGAIILAIVIILVALGIAYNTVHHLINHVHQKPQFPVIIVAVVSILINEGLYYYSLARGRKIQSDLLITNAWHHRSDALVSVIVVISAIGAMFGVYFLDAIGALLIAALIFYMGMRMIWKNTGELIDSGVDENTLKQIRRIILTVPGVISIHQLRTRSHSGYIFVDVHIQVDPTISVSEGHYISEQVLFDLVKNMQAIQDVTVHIDPEDDERAMLSMNLPNRTYIEQILKMQWQQLPGHAQILRLNFHYLNGKIAVEVYLPHEILQSQEIKTLAASYQQAAKSIPEIVSVTLYYE
jgi:cation diffusion facilitator family transporter